jgi:hypothetical protein
MITEPGIITNGRLRAAAPRREWLLSLFVFCQVCFWSVTSTAQPFSIDKVAYVSGNGSSSNSQFVVTLAFGEPVVGSASGAGFALESGFSTAITLANGRPTAMSISPTTQQNVPITISLSGYDPEGGSLSFTITADPAHGFLTGDAPSLIYTPFTDFNGLDNLKFTVTDSEGATSEEATVLIMVSPLNYTPVALPQSLTTSEDVALPITLAATDVENSPLTFQIATPPVHGILSGTAPELIYTPTSNFNGTDC